MAPEQVEQPQMVDHRADIYSLGVVFYEMLTGELPLGKFQPPSKKVQVDVRLDEVVLHALEKEPERRYQHASEVKTALETIAGTAGAQAQPAANPVRILRWRDLWLWDTSNVVAMAMVPMVISFALTGVLWPFWGKRALLCLLLWGLGLAFAATYAFVGAKVRRLRAALPRTDWRGGGSLDVQTPVSIAGPGGIASRSVGDEVDHGRCDYRPFGGYHRCCRGALVQWDPALVEEGLCA